VEKGNAKAAKAPWARQAEGKKLDLPGLKTETTPLNNHAFMSHDFSKVKKEKNRGCTHQKENVTLNRSLVKGPT